MFGLTRLGIVKDVRLRNEDKNENFKKNNYCYLL